MVDRFVKLAKVVLAEYMAWPMQGPGPMYPSTRYYSYDKDAAAESLEGAHNPHMKMEIVPFSKIHGGNMRGKCLKNIVDKYKDMMESEQQIEPIQIVKIDDFYFLHDGNHRLKASQDMNMNAVPAFVTAYRG